MWEEQARKTLSEIVAAFRSEDPDCQIMIPKVQRLLREFGRRNLFRELKEPAGSIQNWMDSKVGEFRTDFRAELESLESALAADDVAKALEHAEAALRLLE